jgi:hypothetical protein
VSEPKRVGFGVSVRTQGGWLWGMVSDPRGFGFRFVSFPFRNPNRLGWGRSLDLRWFGFRSFCVLTQRGLGWGWSRDPKRVWEWVLPCQTQDGWGLGHCPDAMG